MIEKFFNYITQSFIFSTNSSKKEQAYLNYGLKVLIGLLFEVFIIFITAYYLNIFWPVLTAAISFIILRIYAGGAHLPTYLSCLLSSLFIFILIGLLAKAVQPNIIFLYGWLILIFILAFVMINKYAPADTRLIPIKDPKQRLLLKNNCRKIIVCWFLISFILLFLFKNTYLIFASSLGITAEIISIHPLIFALVRYFFPAEE